MVSKDTIPQDSYFIDTHEYLIMIDDEMGRIGISDYAAEQLGDIVFVEMPEVGDTYDKGESFGSIESVKAASDLYMPVSGEITAINNQLTDEPDQVNDDPYKGGWIIEISLSKMDEIKELMDAGAYVNFLKESDG